MGILVYRITNSYKIKLIKILFFLFGIKGNILSIASDIRIMIQDLELFQNKSVLFISDDTIRNKILRKNYESNKKKSLYISLNNELQNIPLACFNPFLYNMKYTDDNMSPENIADKIGSEFRTIYIQDIQFIDSESLKVLRIFGTQEGHHVLASSTVEGILKSSKSIVEIVNLGFEIEYYGKQGENFYPISFIHSISGNKGDVKFNVISKNNVEGEDVLNNLTEEEVETIEETREFIYIIPHSFIKINYPAAYKRMYDLVKKGIFKEDTYNLTPIDSELLTIFGKRLTDKGKNLMISYAREADSKLKNKILSGILYYKAGLWNESASSLRFVINEFFRNKNYRDIINTIETLMKISELTDRDNYVYAVSLNYAGNTRRALKIFDALIQTDYFEKNPDDIVEYIKIIFYRNGFEKATKIIENYSNRMTKENLGNLYMDLSAISINEGDEAHVDYLLQKAEDNLGKGKKVQCEYERLRGNLCLMRKDLKSSLSHYQKSFDIAKEIGDLGLMAKAVNNIGILYSHDLKIIEGLKYFDESRKYALEIKDYSGYSITTANMIPLTMEMGDEDLSFKLLKEIESVPRFSRDSIALSNAYYSIADIYLKRGEIYEAMEYLMKGINYSLERLNNYEISSFLFKLAILKIIIGQDPTLEVEIARMYGDNYSEEYSYWESELAFYKGDIESAKKFIMKSFKDIESSGNRAILLEDGIRLNLYEMLLNGKIYREDVLHIDSKLADINALKIVIRYLEKEIDYNISEKELLALNSKFYYELGRAIISGVEGKGFITSFTGLMNIYNSIRKLFNHQ